MHNFLPKMAEMGSYCHFSQLYDENCWLFSGLCNATSIVLVFCEKESYEEPPQKVGEGDRILLFFTKLCEPSFQVAQLCNVVLSDIQRFKRCPTILNLCTDNLKASRGSTVIDTSQ